MFRVYDEAVEFTYLKSFRRVRVIYSTEEQAQLAQDNLNNHVFEGNSLTLCPVKVTPWNLIMYSSIPLSPHHLIAYNNRGTHFSPPKKNSPVSHFSPNFTASGMGAIWRGCTHSWLQPCHCLSKASITRYNYVTTPHACTSTCTSWVQWSVVSICVHVIYFTTIIERNFLGVTPKNCYGSVTISDSSMGPPWPHHAPTYFNLLG